MASSSPLHDEWSGTLSGTSGNVLVGDLDATTVFTLHCGGPTAGGGCQSVTVTVTDDPPPTPLPNPEPQAGTLRCSGSARNRLALHRDNPHYFEDAAGKPMILASFSTLVPTDPNAPAVLTPVTSTTQYKSDATAMYNLKYPLRQTRIWHLLPWESDAWWPWQRGGSSATCASGLRWDLSHCPANPTAGSECEGRAGLIKYPHATYWNRMVAQVDYTSDRCITSEIMLFDGSGMEESQWLKNPWGKGNNQGGAGFTDLPSCDYDPNDTNGSDDFLGAETFYSMNDQASDNNAVRNAQLAYVRHMLSKVGDKDVIFEIENEHKSTTNMGSWMSRWADFLKLNMPQPRLVSYSITGSDITLGNYNPSNETELDKALKNQNVDIVNVHLGDDYGAGNSDLERLNKLKNLNNYIASRWNEGVTTRTDPGKPISVDEVTMTSEVLMRRLAWTTIASGGHIHSEDSPQSVAEKPIQNILHFLKVSAPWNFVMNRPNRNLIVDTKFCMEADEARNRFVGTWDYLCYYSNIPGNQHVSGNALQDVPNGEYHIRWWDPVNNKFAAGDTFNYKKTLNDASGSGNLPIKGQPTTTQDWVLFVRNLSLGTKKTLRAFNAGTSSYFYTTEKPEYKALAQPPWEKQGSQFQLIADASRTFGGVQPMPFYRLHNQTLQQYYWTADEAERSTLLTQGWAEEGIAGYLLLSATDGVVPLYRMHLGNANFWTTSATEITEHQNNGWDNDGVVGYVVP